MAATTAATAAAINEQTGVAMDVPKDLYQRFKIHSATHGISLQALMVRAICEELGVNPAPYLKGRRIGKKK